MSSLSCGGLAMEQLRRRPFSRSNRPCGSMRTLCSGGLRVGLLSDRTTAVSQTATRLVAPRRAGQKDTMGQGDAMFMNPPADDIAQLLRAAHTIAVVGLSADPT